MSDKKTMNEELGMEYSPILGVTYGLVNVTPKKTKDLNTIVQGFLLRIENKKKD